jgi:hypothetical protein
MIAGSVFVFLVEVITKCRQGGDAMWQWAGASKATTICPNRI